MSVSWLASMMRCPRKVSQLRGGARRVQEGPGPGPGGTGRDRDQEVARPDSYKTDATR